MKKHFISDQNALDLLTGFALFLVLLLVVGSAWARGRELDSQRRNLQDRLDEQKLIESRFPHLEVGQ